MDPGTLPEDIKLTPELIKSLDEYGDLGKAVQALVAQTGINKEVEVKVSEDRTTEQQQKHDDYQTYVKGNTEFARIMDAEKGSDEQETLEHFYTQVTKSPGFKDKPLSEQLDEVMVRTNRAFGKDTIQAKEVADPSADEAKAIADTKLKAARESATPASPSEVGISDKGQQKTIDRARAASGQDLLNVVGELSNAELEALLDDMD